VPRIVLAEGVSVHCAVDDFLWPWDRSAPVLMMHGFARNATFWNRWVPAAAESHRVYRPDLLGCGRADQPPKGLMGTLSGYLGLRLALALGAILSGGFWLATRFQHKRMAAGLEHPPTGAAEGRG
jgi:pimeloyl-ACP methyl ester carboxylesterase